jgi:3-phosphoglycerate kinase
MKAISSETQKWKEIARFSVDILRGHTKCIRTRCKLKLTKKPVEPIQRIRRQRLHYDGQVQDAIEALKNGTVVLLENVRFYKEETDNAEFFSQKLTAIVDTYVIDAFGCAHRVHASTARIAKFLSLKVAGFLIEQELQFLKDKTANPERPFTVFL